MGATITRGKNGITVTGRDAYTRPATIDLQGRVVQLKQKTRVPSDRVSVRMGGRRGRIEGFSRASRRRLLTYTARLKADQRPLFLTLTYAQTWPNVKTCFAHRRAFLERVRRKFPDAAGVWRVEMQKRGAPHFHILLFKVSFWHAREVQQIWADVIGYEYWDGEGPGGFPFTRVEAIRSARGVMYYVGKYVAKTGDAASDGFNHDAYLHGHRHWGWFRKDALPWDDQIIIKTVWGSNDVFNTFKRYLRRYKHGRYVQDGSCTVFVGSAARWRALWHDICVNGHYR